MTIDLRSRQQPLKERYRADAENARLVHSVHSIPVLDDPTRVRISNGNTIWEIAAHPMAGGPDGEACSGDVLLAALAGCQEITIKMVAASMGVTLDDLRVTVTGEMDFRGTMGIDRAVPVGYTRIRCQIAIRAQGDPDRLQRLVERAEQYCVVRDTLVRGVPVQSEITINEVGAVPAR
ncbi:MAG TPA: OsmC family protein [Chloroflexota bacterium]|nr:OsmC family protein [Chloroflexota bacterium]